MNTVKVVVGGKDYTISTSEDSSHVYSLARNYDKKLKDFMSANKGASQYTASVFVGLSLLEDLAKSSENNDEILNMAKSYIDQAGKVRIENDTLKRENDDLKAKLQRAEEMLGEIQNSSAEKSTK